MTPAATDAAQGPALGTPRLHLRRTDSTNERARELAIAGAPNGTLVTASEQTAGRGRQGRTWAAPAGRSLLMSLLVRYEHDHVPTLLPLAAAVAVCEVVGERARIKWPNDVVVQTPGPERGDVLAKLAGILLEGRPQAGWTVVGIGLNVAVELEQLPADVRVGAATLGLSPAHVEPTLEAMLAALERRLSEPPQDVLRAWRERDALLGRAVEWGPPSPGAGAPGVPTSASRADASRGSGTASGIDGTGRLIVTLPSGGRTELSAGEVHLRHGPGGDAPGG